jgi:hypothetical protein
MKVFRNTIILVAASAIFHWATAQNAVNMPLAEQCIPANSFAELPAALAGTQTDAYGKTTVALGSYERISPDGRFVLRSFSGGRLGDVSLIELSSAGIVVAAHDTPLSNEAFPVQGSWRYVVDVNGDHYTFSSLLRNINKDTSRIAPVFRGGMTGFYAAAAELPVDAARSQAGHVLIRSMSWPNTSGDSESQGRGALVARTIEVDTVRQRITADSGFVNLCNERVREDGPLYALPMISVDGLEFAALPQTPVKGEPTMRIFSFDDSTALNSSGGSPKQTERKKLGCTPKAAFTFSSGKTIFGHPQSAAGGGQRPGDLAYEYQSQVWWVHRGAGMGAGTDTAAQGNGNGQRFNIAPYYDSPRTQLLASAFPGITKDGRVIYGATLKDCPADPSQPCADKAGYVISDPYQSNAYQAFLRQHKGPARRQCITHGDVERERATFAKLHGLGK